MNYICNLTFIIFLKNPYFFRSVFEIFLRKYSKNGFLKQIQNWVWYSNSGSSIDSNVYMKCQRRFLASFFHITKADFSSTRSKTLNIKNLQKTHHNLAPQRQSTGIVRFGAQIRSASKKRIHFWDRRSVDCRWIFCDALISTSQR